jgi:hypothetical protein
VNGGGTSKTIDDKNESMLGRRRRKEIKLSSISNIVRVIPKNELKIGNSKIKPFTPRSANDVVLGLIRKKRLDFKDVRDGRRKRKIFCRKDKTIIKKTFNGAIPIRRGHLYGGMNGIVFDAKVRSGGDKNDFDVIIVKIEVRNSGLNGLVFARCDVRFIYKNENILKMRNFFGESGKLVAMENIVSKLRRETFLGLLSPFSRRMPSNNENIVKRKR